MNHQGKKRQRQKQRGKTGDETSDPVQVFCRIKPVHNSGAELCVRRLTDKLIQVYPPQDKSGQKPVNCTFQYVFDDDSAQRVIFEEVGLPLVEDVIQGKNCVLFTYGVTSSGKTHSMSGTCDDPGIIPRSLDVIFDSLHSHLAPKGTFRPDKFNGFDIIDTENLTDREKFEPRTYPGVGRRLGNDVDWSQRIKEHRTVTVPAENEDVRSAFGIFISYTSIHNEHVYDLLQHENDTPGMKKNVTLQIKQLRELHDERNFLRSVYVNNVTEVEVRTAEEALAIFQKGHNIRQTAATLLNDKSSRSHAIFNVRLVQGVVENRTNKILYDKELIAVSQLSLVDLAGSERAKRTQNAGERLKEAGCINKSLMTLRDCLDSLRANQKLSNPEKHKIVPYRDSILTRLFSTHFKGEGRVRMLVCINPIAAEYGENLKVLEFAESTQEIQVNTGPQGRFNDLLSSGRQAAANYQAEAEAEMNRKRKAEEDELDHGTRRSYKQRYSSLKEITIESTFINHQVAGHADSETLPALSRYLEDRINRHKKEYADLKALGSNTSPSGLRLFLTGGLIAEDEFYALLCSFASEKQRLWQLNSDLEKDLQAQRILSGRLEGHLNTARSILEDVVYHLGSTGIGKEIRDKIKSFQRGDFPTRPNSHLRPEDRSGMTPGKYSRMQTQMEYSSTTSTDNSPYGRTRNVTQNRAVFQQSSDLLSAATNTPRARQTGRAPFNINHPGKRRSKSADRAIVHLDKNNAPNGSVLKPDIRRGRVHNEPPTAKKLNGASDYYLFRQPCDEYGAIENQVFHGNVIPTAGQPSGSAVIFDSIEKHRVDEVVPLSERLNSEVFRPREPSVSREEIQSRCAVSFSHKSPAKQSPTKKHP